MPPKRRAAKAKQAAPRDPQTQDAIKAIQCSRKATDQWLNMDPDDADFKQRETESRDLQYSAIETVHRLVQRQQLLHDRVTPTNYEQQMELLRLLAIIQEARESRRINVPDIAERLKSTMDELSTAAMKNFGPVARQPWIPQHALNEDGQDRGMYTCLIWPHKECSHEDSRKQ